VTSTLCSTPARAIAIALALAFAFASASGSAFAQNSAAIAEGLFRDGKKLLDQKRYAEACPKFEESARLDPSSGVKLALGICYEGLGKLASAWGAYLDAISLARRDGRRDREKAATERSAALEHKIAHVTFDVPPGVAQLPGLVVKEDGVAIGAAAWKNAPIDPGDHSLEVSATGKKPFSTSFSIGAGADSKTVPVPELEDAPRVEGGGPGEAPPVTTRPLATYGFVALGVGAASIVTGSILGGIAIADAADVRKVCSAPTCSNASAVAENSTAATLADWSTVTFIVGGVALAASVVMFLVKGKRVQPAATALQPMVGPRWIGLGGAW